MRVSALIRFDVKQLENSVDDFVAKVASDVETAARINTPKKSGNARKNWRKTKTNDGFSIENTVPYIGRLEAGASKQAPRGIIGPTLGAIRRKY